jgi:hypothetical protein
MINALLAALRQEDVFKSISDNVGESGVSGRMLAALALVAAAVLVLLVLLSSRRQREVTPRTLNHHGKLLKEVMRKVPLRPAEVKQLRILAESRGDSGPRIENPLTLVLCPSLLAKAMKAKPARIDKKTVATLAHKMGLVKKSG